MADLNKIIEDLSSLTVVEALSFQTIRRKGSNSVGKEMPRPAAGGQSRLSRRKSEFTVVLASVVIKKLPL